MDLSSLVSYIELTITNTELLINAQTEEEKIDAVIELLDSIHSLMN